VTTLMRFNESEGVIITKENTDRDEEAFDNVQVRTKFIKSDSRT
jgi:hypothetical protein